MLSPNEVAAAYTAILRRAPESDQVIDHHRHFESVQELCRALIGSPEFSELLAQEHGVRPQTWTTELDEAVRAFETNDRAAWDGRVLVLPDWFDYRMDPDTTEYRVQMLRLWSEITGRAEYRPGEHEDTPEVGEADAIYRPAFYASGDSHFAGGQMIAMGLIIQRSRIGAGDRVLEYGAGFGQTALALARLGATVDTVDINPGFCKAVQASADHYGVPLHPHVGEFGINPAGHDHAYDVVLFYESFHHCLDFHALIAQLPTLLKPGGRVLLAGEPIFDDRAPEMPYPWGFRLDWENAAIMRQRGWMELGFQRDYLIAKFTEAGFDHTLHADPNSHWATIHEFTRREDAEA